VSLALLCGSQSLAAAHAKKKPHRQKAPVTQTTPLSLNKATAVQLKKLPGIGVATAKRIVVYREQHRRFKALSELLHVRGMSQHKLQRLEKRLSL
jgi:competence protein ComEA